MIPTRLAKTLSSLLAVLLPAGCHAPPKPTLADLQFPVLVIYPGAGHERFDSPAALADMSTQRVLMHHDTPLLIDSALRIFQLADLKSTQSGLSLMASAGTGRTPVAFTLTATRDSGIAAARALVQKYCTPLHDGPDAPRRREQLATAETIPQIIAAIEGDI